MKDAKSIRRWRIPAISLGAASFFTAGQTSAGVMNSVAAARTALRSTEWGKHNKKLIYISSLAPVLASTLLNTEDPVDTVPLIISILGGGADYTAQGRYQRFIITLAGLIATHYCIDTNNPTMAISSGFSTIASGVSGVRYDIKDAAGPGRSFKENWLAYRYGIRHNAPTGADKSSQVASGESKYSDARLYYDFLTTKENPYIKDLEFITMLAEAEARPNNLEPTHLENNTLMLENVQTSSEPLANQPPPLPHR